MKYYELNIKGFDRLVGKQWFYYRLYNMKTTQVFWYAREWGLFDGEIGPINSAILINLN